MAIPTKIMTIGDSITHGVIGNGGTESGGYRTELWNLFAADGLAVDFVGPRASGPSHIDRNHAGMRGWRTDQILYGRSTEPTAGNLDDWLNADTPDLVLLKIGTNDILQDFQLSTAPDRLSEIIDEITKKAPNAQVVVSSVLPIDRTQDLQQAKTYNSFIPGIVSSKVSQGKKVSFVNMFDKLTMSDLPDQIHPSLDGYVKMGNAWYDALVPILGLDKKIRVQAEEMTLTNYRVETENATALGRKLIGLSSSNPTGKASFNFNGTSGNYDIVVGFYDENDGQASLAFKAGSKLLDQWTLDKKLGSAGADSKTLQRRTVATNFSLKNGTNIEIEGIVNQSEFARVDYIEFIPKESLSTVSLSVDNVSQANGKTHTFTVTYADDDGINISTIDSSDVQVSGPNGFSQLAQLVSVNSSSDGSPRTATYRMDAPNGSWGASDNGNYTVSLRSNQVADRKDNYILAGDLGSFQVNVSPAEIPLRIEAENMQRSNYLVVSNSAASGGQLASLPIVKGPNTGTLNTTFNGASGTYDIVLRFADENDGKAQLRTNIAGNQIDSRVLNQGSSWGGVDSRTMVTQIIATDLYVNNGDRIEIQGIAEAAEFARVDYIEFVPVSLISGTDVVDSLTGASANNTTYSFAGNDTLNEDVDNDTLIGGSDADVSVLPAENREDVITDFIHGSDRLSPLANLTSNQLTIFQRKGSNLNNSFMSLSSLSSKTRFLGTGDWGLGAGNPYKSSISQNNQVYLSPQVAESLNSIKFVEILAREWRSLL
ncbi:MAG: GDSL-type esterase/lipase family protein [Phormidium sp.]